MEVHMADKQKAEKSKGDRNGTVYYRRMLRIDELIAGGTYPSVRTMMKDDDIMPASRATIYRTIEFMRDQLNAPIALDHEHNGYYYTEKAFRLPAMFTTEGELFAAGLVKNMIEGLHGTPVYDQAKRALETFEKSTVKNPNDRRVLRTFDAHDDTENDLALDRYLFLEDTRLEIDNTVWDTLRQALNCNHAVTFDYTGDWDTEPKHRKAAPWQLLYSRNVWFLWCWDYDREDHRLFALNRMQNIEMTKESFSLPKNYDYRSFSNGVFGAFVGEDEYTFRIQFYDSMIHKVCERIWGKDQMIEKQPDGSIILSFTGSQYYPVLQMIQSCGDEAVPLAPENLVNDWKDAIRRMAKAAGI